MKNTLKIVNERQWSLVALGVGVCGVVCGTEGKLFADAKKPTAPSSHIQYSTARSSLRVSISGTADITTGMRFVAFRESAPLRQTPPHINVIIQNISTHPIKIFGEWNSWGYHSLYLEITAMDGKALSKPMFISRGGFIFTRNGPGAETLAPGEAIVREMWLRVPHSRDYAISDYADFPFPPKGRRRRIIMRVVFDPNKSFEGAVPVKSPLYEYEIGSL